MNDILETLKKLKLVPVVSLDDSEKAVSVMKSLANGGINCIEVTFRTKAAADSIKNIRQCCQDALVGAGTVLSIEQAEAAIKSGAEFVVSPGINPDVVRYCIDKGVAVIPGCMTPTDIETAIRLDLNLVKFFPAVAAGGVAMLKAVSAPYPYMSFLPTGGINKDNIKDFLSLSQVVACGGSWIAPKNLINSEKYSEITMLTAEAIKVINN